MPSFVNALYLNVDIISFRSCNLCCYWPNLAALTSLMALAVLAALVVLTALAVLAAGAS